MLLHFTIIYAFEVVASICMGEKLYNGVVVDISSQFCVQCLETDHGKTMYTIELKKKNKTTHLYVGDTLPHRET